LADVDSRLREHNAASLDKATGMVSMDMGDQDIGDIGWRYADANKVLN